MWPADSGTGQKNPYLTRQAKGFGTKVEWQYLQASHIVRPVTSRGAGALLRWPAYWYTEEL